MDETKKMHKTLMDYLWCCGLCKPIRNILCCMRYYNPHVKCVCARPDRYPPLSPANVCFLMQRVLHSFSVSSSFNISTWQWLFKRRPPGGYWGGGSGRKKWIRNIHLWLCYTNSVLCLCVDSFCYSCGVEILWFNIYGVTIFPLRSQCLSFPLY